MATELAVLNAQYCDRYGFIFIICARGRSSPEILSELRRRYGRPAAEELQVSLATFAQSYASTGS